MLIFGQTPNDYVKKVKIILSKSICNRKRFLIILIIVLSCFLFSCSKVDFDPTTTTVKWSIKNWKGDNDR